MPLKRILVITLIPVVLSMSVAILMYTLPHPDTTPAVLWIWLVLFCTTNSKRMLKAYEAFMGTIPRIEGCYPQGSILWALQMARAGHAVTRNWEASYSDGYIIWGEAIGENCYIRVNTDKSLSSGRYSNRLWLETEDIVANDWHILRSKIIEFTPEKP